MWQVFQTIATSLGATFEAIVTFVVMAGMLIFFAVSFQRGLALSLLGSAGLLLWFYAENLNYLLPMVIFFMVLVLMALSLYMEYKASKSVGLI